MTESNNPQGVIESPKLMSQYSIEWLKNEAFFPALSKFEKSIQNQDDIIENYFMYKDCANNLANRVLNHFSEEEKQFIKHMKIHFIEFETEPEYENKFNKLIVILNDGFKFSEILHTSGFDDLTTKVPKSPEVSIE